MLPTLSSTLNRYTQIHFRLVISLFENHNKSTYADFKTTDDPTIIKNFYKTITDEDLTNYQEKKIHQLLNQVINRRTK